MSEKLSPEKIASLTAALTELTKRPNWQSRFARALQSYSNPEMAGKIADLLKEKMDESKIDKTAAGIEEIYKRRDRGATKFYEEFQAALQELHEGKPESIIELFVRAKEYAHTSWSRTEDDDGAIRGSILKGIEEPYTFGDSGTVSDEDLFHNEFTYNWLKAIDLLDWEKALKQHGLLQQGAN
jgi:hypothetical protein